MDARKHKRNTINQLKFERNLENELLSLANELENLSYTPRPSICFINELSVKREIIAADFRDRVIHHFLYNRIYPYWDKKFIYDSYSCRVGKGTLFGIRRAQGFLRSASENYKKECWILRLDIQGYFMAIDRGILFDLINDSCLHGNDNLIEFLIHKIVFNDPLANVIYKSLPSAWSDLPKDKSLKYSDPNCGLPIGNLTSQLFSNIYLNSLDHFVKRELKIKYYGRYVDDMILIHRDKEVLLNSIEEIRIFLSKKLHLKLHPKKIKLQPSINGFSFLGVFIKPDKTGKFKVLAGRRIMSNFKKCVLSPSSLRVNQTRGTAIQKSTLQNLFLPEKHQMQIQSYLGLLDKYAKES